MLGKLLFCYENLTNNRESLMNYGNRLEQMDRQERLLNKLIKRLNALETDKTSVRPSVVTTSDDDSEYLKALEEFGLCD